MMGRRRLYATNAEKQAAYRHHKAQESLSQIPQLHGEGYAVYNGDARQILRLLGESLGVLITDPPYGVLRAPDAQGRATKGTGGKHGLVREPYASYEDTYENFVRTIVPILNLSLDRVQRGAVFTGEQTKTVQRPPTVEGGVYCPAGAGRHQWGFRVFHHVLFYGRHPKLEHGARGSTGHYSTETAEKSGHPCPKPIGWMRWLVELCSLPGETVFDPFMGSGTTGVACVEYGRRFVGIELDPGYFAIACERLARATAQGQLFHEPAQQMQLLSRRGTARLSSPTPTTQERRRACPLVTITASGLSGCLPI
jgi:hypothetical protein